MSDRITSLRRNLSQSLGFVPGVIVFVFAVLGIVLVEIDRQLDLDGVKVVFEGDGGAARTVLSVIAGSLITVAGLTFSITMVVLQLASSQFSPRILRTFFGDRITQITIGTYVGTFVYAILVLRAVGSFGDAGFVPRLSVTVASLLGIGAVILLVVFLHHVSLLIQVSHVVGNVAHDTLARIDVLHPEPLGRSVEDREEDELLASWRAEAPGRVLPHRPGFVQRIGLHDLTSGLSGRADRLAILVCPGDFVSVETPIAEVWPAAAAERCGEAIAGAISIADERDLDQDVGFGIQQLTDTALKGISPGINDPATAVTCIGYLQAILVRLAGRAAPSGVRRFPDRGVTVIVRSRGFEEHLESLVQVARYVDADAWVAGKILRALEACAAAAAEVGSEERLAAVLAVAGPIAGQAVEDAKSDRDLAALTRALAAVEEAARRPGREPRPPAS